MIRKYTEEHTEETEGARPPDAVIYDGDWKLNIHTNKVTRGYGMRRYHHHDDDWYTVRMNAHGWVCNKCQTPTPDTMEGDINLARWAINAD